MQPTLRETRHPRAWKTLFVFSLLLSLALACKFPVTLFDTTTYKNLTDLKPEVVALYQTFTKVTVDQPQAAQVTLKLEQAYEYENGKGTQNDLTMIQFKLIKNIFKRAVDNRLQSGPWTTQAEADYEKNICDAFDIAIASENTKNKK